MRLTTYLIISAFVGVLCSCDENNVDYEVNTEGIAQEAIEDFETFKLKINLIDRKAL
ncbi:MAG: hypothetical protein ACKVJP_06950 [Flavobacteriales bacterium]|tara:strand:+ start:323 stop:493 length:171 start_codon:yes stop_codon:yes gene_type:complete